MTRKKVKICPKCGSVSGRFLASGLYKCERVGCGHQARASAFRKGGPTLVNRGRDLVGQAASEYIQGGTHKVAVRYE